MALSIYTGRILAASLHGLLILPASILFVISLYRARRHSDPARSGLAWLRAVFIFAIAGATLTVLSFGLTIHLSSDRFVPDPNDPNDPTNPSRVSRILRTSSAALYISTVGTLLSLLSDILLLFTLVELTRGFVLTRRPRAARLARTVLLAGAGVLGVLALVAFGLAVRYDKGVLALANGEVYPTWKVTRDTLAVMRVSGAVDVVGWVGSLGGVGWVVWVVRGVRGAEGRSVSLVLAAAIATSLRALGLMVMAAMYGFSLGPVTPEEIFVVRPVVDVVPLLVVLVLLFVVSIRKEGGLWSAAPVVGQTVWYGQSQEAGEYALRGAPVEGYYKPQKVSQVQGRVPTPEAKWC